MSELTRCNYCNLQRYRAFAAASGQEAVLKQAPEVPDESRVPRGVSLYVHTPGTSEEQDRWVCWFAELSDHCVC